MLVNREEIIIFIKENDAFYAKLNLTRLNDECLALMKEEIELEKKLSLEDSENSNDGISDV